jgi:hypothetical protein
MNVLCHNERLKTSVLVRNPGYVAGVTVLFLLLFILAVVHWVAVH